MKADELIRIAQRLADERPQFFNLLGPGGGNYQTNAFMAELRDRAFAQFGVDYAEARISGENGLKVDYYLPDEATIVEIALSLRNSNSEYEKDILKATLAKHHGNAVGRLLFLSRPGGIATCRRPAHQAIASWARDSQEIAVDVHDFVAVPKR